MADSRHTRAGLQDRRTLRSDAFWIASKQAVARRSAEGRFRALSHPSHRRHGHDLHRQQPHQAGRGRRPQDRRRAGVRPICDRAWTWRASPTALFLRIRRIHPGVKLAGPSVRQAASGRCAPTRAACGRADDLHLRNGESLPSLRRQSNECSRRQGYQALAREGELT